MSFDAKVCGFTVFYIVLCTCTDILNVPNPIVPLRLHYIGQSFYCRIYCLSSQNETYRKDNGQPFDICYLEKESRQHDQDCHSTMNPGILFLTDESSQSSPGISEAAFIDPRKPCMRITSSQRLCSLSKARGNKNLSISSMRSSITYLSLSAYPLGSNQPWKSRYSMLFTSFNSKYLSSTLP